MPRAKKPVKSDALDTFISQGLERALMLVLWKVRHQYPEMAIPITAADIEAFDASCRFTKQEPCIRVFRRPAIPASPGQPAVGKRRETPPSAAKPAGKVATVLLVAKDTEAVDPGTHIMFSPGDAIRPVESDDKDHDTASLLRDIRRLKETGPQLAREVMADAATGTFSSAKVQEICQAVVTMAKV